MSREIVSQLKFKKSKGSFNLEEFSEKLNKAYLSKKRENKFTKKESFSPSTIGYGHGNCARYWYIAFNGAIFEEQQDSVAIANMMNGTQAHERLQDLIKDMDWFKEEEREMLNQDPPIRGFADLIFEIDNKEIIGEIKTAKEEVFLHKQSSLKPSGNHLIQLLIYMKINNSDEGFFIYENKNTQEVVVIPIEMNKANKQIVDEAFEWMSTVWSAYKEDTLPTRSFTKSSTVCKGCPVRSECYSKENGIIEIDKFEAPKL